MHRMSDPALPHDESFALISNANGGKITVPEPRFRERLASEPHDGAVNLLSVVLDPSRMRIILANLTIGARSNTTASIHHHDSGSSGPLVNREHASRQFQYPPRATIGEHRMTGKGAHFAADAACLIEIAKP
jgi:hypothetical protein